jgi:hypothetical protein
LKRTWARPVWERLDGIVGEGRAQQVAADPLELLAVAAVDGVAACRCMPNADTESGGRVTGSSGVTR